MRRERKGGKEKRKQKKRANITHETLIGSCSNLPNAAVRTTGKTLT